MRVTVDLSWGHSDPQDIAGYRVSWVAHRQTRKVVTVQRDVNVMQFSVLLKAKTVYTFSVSAYDVAGNESKPRILKAVYVE